jgi:hypothetical protein
LQHLSCPLTPKAVEKPQFKVLESIIPNYLKNITTLICSNTSNLTEAPFFETSLLETNQEQDAYYLTQCVIFLKIYTRGILIVLT